MRDIANSFTPLIPGSPEQLAARGSAMRNLVHAVSESVLRGETTVAKTVVDDLAASFPMPVIVEIDWESVTRRRSPDDPNPHEFSVS
jgi:hypothetical protein